MLLYFFVRAVINAPQLDKSTVLTVAVASNFLPTMKGLAHEFNKETGHKLKLSSGSSGKHYSQIKNGAPFDVFFSADKKRPMLLEQESIAVKDTRFTYAIGRLVLLGYDTNVVEKKMSALSDPSIQRLAIANPRLAPYGIAAQQALTSLGLWSSLQSRVVRGENVNQAFQFVVSGNAQIALVSYAQVVGGQQLNFWLLPSDMHKQIEQQAVIIKDSKIARELMTFMRSERALTFIKAQGYDIPLVYGGS